MKFTKFFGTSIHLLLIFFVTPSYQLVNENVKDENKHLTKIQKQIPTRNIGKLQPVTAQKLTVKASPIRITPQPLLTRRKVQRNPTGSAKPNGFIKNNKPSNSAKVDEPKSKHDSVEDKERSKNVNSASKATKHEEKSMFSEEIEDMSCNQKDKEDEPKQNIPDCSKENYEEEHTGQEESDNKEMVASKDLKSPKHEDTAECDNTSQHSSNEGDIKDDDDVLIDIHEEYKICSNKPKNISLTNEINSPDKKNVTKMTYIPLKGDSHVEPNKYSDHARKYENSEKKISYTTTTPRLTKVEINVNPKLMEKLTNDANDKIFIKKLDFEELQEKYDLDSCSDDKNEPNDSPYAPDTTFLKASYKYPLEDQIDLDEICGNPITNRHFRGGANKNPRERIWRAWKNSEIHVKSDHDKKKKRKNAEKNKPNINCFDAKRYDSVYGNIKFNPCGGYALKTDQDNKPNNFEKVFVDSNNELDPVTYKTSEIQDNVADVRHVEDNSSVKIAPDDRTYTSRPAQSNILTYDEPRFCDYNKAKFGPVRYGTYILKAYYGNRPRNFHDLKRYFGGYGSAKFQPFKYEPYITMPQRNIWYGMAPEKPGIRYYSPPEYSLPPIPNCYYPQSYGTQYAPVSRYQKYLFPCM